MLALDKIGKPKQISNIIKFLINPENDWVDHFTVEELNKIWHPDAQDNIMYWSQVREGWPNEELHLFGPGTASGTYDYFAEAICGKKVGTRGDYTASEDDHVLVQGISTDKYGLGFFFDSLFEEKPLNRSFLLSFFHRVEKTRKRRADDINDDANDEQTTT